jgi:chromosome segregation ATPase
MLQKVTSRCKYLDEQRKQLKNQQKSISNSNIMKYNSASENTELMQLLDKYKQDVNDLQLEVKSKNLQIQKLENSLLNITSKKEDEINEIQTEVKVKEKIIDDYMMAIKKLKMQHVHEKEDYESTISALHDELSDVKQQYDEIENQLVHSRESEKTVLTMLQKLESDKSNTMALVKKESKEELTKLQNECAQYQKALKYVFIDDGNILIF